jgi:hypothetical protein
LALIILVLLALHTAQPYIEDVQHPAPLFDPSSAVLLALLIAVAILPEIETLKVWFLEFRTRPPVQQALKQVEQTFASPGAQHAAAAAATRLPPNPRKIISDAQTRLSDALRALAARKSVKVSDSLSAIVDQLQQADVLDEKKARAATSIIRAITNSLALGTTLETASELEYATDLLVESLAPL